MKTLAETNAIAAYVAEIDRIWRTGNATEHSYRGALQQMLSALMPGLMVLNEPKKQACGAQLRAAHLMKDPPPPLSERTAAFPVAGDNVVEAVRFEGGRVYINDAQYFDNVPKEDFELFIGGYQPAQKWLKDRKGRTLARDDLRHYQRIVLALRRTRESIDALSGVANNK